MASTVTTLAIFKTLMLRSVDLDPNLDASTKAAMKTRIQNIASEQEIVLDQPRVLSAQGNASENAAKRSIDVLLGAPASRVEFDPITYFVPVRVDGTHGVGGFLPGHAGASALPLVAQDEITLQYRLAASDPWADFDRSTVLPEVTWIQFAANIAQLLANSSVPAIHVHAEQV